MAHTPGPWSASPFPNRYGAVVAERCPQGDTPEERERCNRCDTAYHSGTTGFETYGGHLLAESISSKEDCLLIAAAPDLLTFVRKVDAQLRGDLLNPVSRQLANEATYLIARATWAAPTKAEGLDS